MSIFFVCCFCS